MISGFLSRLTYKYIVERCGAIGVTFAVMAPLLFGASGMALDLGQSYLVRQRLAGALDAAALAATATETSEADIQARVDQFMAVNYPEGKIGEIVVDSIDVNVDGDDVTVSAQARYDTSFMRVLGIKHMNVAASTTIHRAIKGLEAVMVLDNTGSMGSTNMTYLRTAATNFVNILFARAQKAEDIKIGIVPYASSVRIGRYGLGLTPDGEVYDDTPFVTLPHDVSYTTNHGSSSGWYGCVVEHNDGQYDPDVYDFTTADYVDGSYGQLWQHPVTEEYNGHGWNPGTTSNDPAPYDSSDDFSGPWDIYMYGDVDEDQECIASHEECVRYRSNGTCRRYETVCDEWVTTYEFDKGSEPNSGCPYAYIRPMTSNQTALLNHIPTMQHHGNTYSNIGMAWGMRLVSPEAPFTEGAAWTDKKWQKAVILMTDGEMSPNGTYSAYWDSQRLDLQPENVDTPDNNIAILNERLLEVCDYLKSKGVIIYTVNFKHASSDISESTKQVYKNCASQPWEDHYRFATNGTQLNEMFEDIATRLARLHISK